MHEIINTIPFGKRQAIHQAELAERCGCSTSEVKQAIQTARRAGIVILSGGCGYWRDDDPAAQAAFLRMMDGQSKSRFLTTRSLRQALRDDPEQMTLADMEGGAEE